MFLAESDQGSLHAQKRLNAATTVKSNHVKKNNQIHGQRQGAGSAALVLVSMEPRCTPLSATVSDGAVSDEAGDVNLPIDRRHAIRAELWDSENRI
jgi:hypothetical protein